MWYACDPEILTEILPVIVIVLLCGGGAFGLTGMGAPPTNLHSIPFILNVDWQAENKIYVSQARKTLIYENSRHWLPIIDYAKKDYCWAIPRMNRLYGRLTNSKRLGCTRNRHIKLQLIFAVESIGVDGIRWKLAQQGASLQLFFGRQRKSQISGIHSIPSKTGLIDSSSFSLEKRLAWAEIGG